MRFLCYGRTAKDNKIQFSVKNKKKCDALLYFSTICSVSLQEHFALFRHKKQSLRNCCRILNINLVIGIYKSNTSKLQILPIPTRHLQIQYQQIADASEPRICICKSNSSKLQMLPTPGQASTNPIPANCRYFQPRPGIYKSNSSKLQMLPNPTRHLQIQIQQIADTSEPGQASANPNPANCRCFQPQDRHLQIHIQQIADTSDPDQASANPIPANCRYFHVRNSPLYVSTNLIPANCRYFRPQDRHLQIQIQQIADTSNPDQASANSIPANCRCFRTQDMYLQVQYQQVADASNPDQASANPIPANCRYFHIRNSPLYVSANPNPANCRCFQPRSGICKSKSSKLQMLPNPTRHLQLQFQQIADASNPDQASAATKNNKSKMPTGEFSSQIRRWASLFHLYCIFISSNSYICLFLIRRGLSRPVSWHLFWVFPVFHRFPYAHLWKSLPTRQLLLLSVPDGFCPR